MDPSTPARSALHYALEEFRRPRARPTKTWLSMMKQQLRSELNMNLWFSDVFRGYRKKLVA